MKCDQVKKVLLCFVLFCLFISTNISAKIYLLSVGIADYPGVGRDLLLPGKDAEGIAWLYSKQKEVEVRTLINEEATEKAIISALNELFVKAGKSDQIVLFFSGHGYEGGFMAYDRPIDYGSIRKCMAVTDCTNKIIFADACYAGQIRTGKNTINSTSENNDEMKKANVLLFLSSRSNEASRERKDMQNGYFTTFLLKGLRGAADKNKDRVITAKELFLYVHKKVVEISAKKQHPVMWGRFHDNTPIISW